MRRRRVAAWIAAAVVVVAAMCAGGLAFLRKRDRVDEARQQSAAAAALTLYLRRVEAGDYRSAYGQLCSDVLYDYSEHDHEVFLHGQPIFASFRLGRPVEHTGMDGTYESFRVTLIGVDGVLTTCVIDVGMQVDGPKVCDGLGWRRL